MTDAIEPKRLLFPGLARLYERFSPYSYALIRFAAGAVLVPHGIQKLVNGSAEGLAKAIAAHGLPAPLALTWLAILPSPWARRVWRSACSRGSPRSSCGSR